MSTITKTTKAVIPIFIYHDKEAKSEQLLKEIRTALIKRLGSDVVFLNKPDNAQYVYGVYLDDKKTTRVLRRLGAQ